MRVWVRMTFVLMAILVGLVAPHGSVKAAPSPPTLELSFVDLPEYFVVGKTYKLEVESLSMEGEVKKVEFAFAGGTNEEVQNIETVLTNNGKYYKITGDFTPKKKGNYTLKCTVGAGDEESSYTIDSITTKIKVLNEGDIFAPADPVESKMMISTNHFEVGKTVKITVSTPKKGTTYENARFELVPSPDGGEKVQSIRTVSLNNSYATTGYLTPQQEGEYKINFRMRMSDVDGSQWEAIASKTIKVKKVEPKKIKVTFIPLLGNPSLREDGQAVVIAKVPKYYADQGYRVDWSDNVTGFGKPASSDNLYTYIVGLFKANEAGEHKVTFKVSRDQQWIGEATMKIVVTD
ncbi:hypothetical protein [Brevibacillus choshinensis]|uniref:hypothetical protein n=1 Tax=Brevibacillus choshinensis TaxID=54911 RepID=UPI002E1B1140|nr:hypothetical protein [Brevibacillus choshinensis]